MNQLIKFLRLINGAFLLISISRKVNTQIQINVGLHWSRQRKGITQACLLPLIQML